MESSRSLGRNAVAGVLVLCLAMPACITFKTNTDLRIESFNEPVTVYQKDAKAEGGYVPVATQVTRYRLTKTQKKVIDVGETILTTLKLGPAFIALLYLMGTTKTLRNPANAYY